MEKQGIRIQKVLSDSGILSRRKAEEAILLGRVKVNGHPALIGQKINPRKDIVSIDGVNAELKRHKKNLYVMLNKPRGYVTTTSDEMGRQCVLDLLSDVPEKVYPIGRLDKVSEGLLLLTNDGDFANLIMHPKNNITKTYRATVRPDITEEQAIKLATGVEIDGRKTSPAAVHVLTREPGRAVLQISIHEGRNRQIRKMCEAVGLTVARLKRTTVGPVKLGMLQPGKWRELTPQELAGLRGSAVKGAQRQAHASQSPAAKQPDKRGKPITSKNKHGPRPNKKH